MKHRYALYIINPHTGERAEEPFEYCNAIKDCVCLKGSRKIGNGVYLMRIKNNFDGGMVVVTHIVVTERIY